MGKLEFDGDAVRELYVHSRNSEKHRSTYGGAAAPALLLVHDHGVYLMSAGLPSLPSEDKPGSSKVVYAKGCDPRSDDAWYEEARDLVGGDDFAEALPLNMFENIFEAGLEGINIVVKLTATQVTVTYNRGRTKPQRESVEFVDEVMDFGDF